VAEAEPIAAASDGGPFATDGSSALPYDGWGKMRACKFHSLYRLIDRAWELEARTWRESI